MISVIVPVHNERATLATCIEKLLAVDCGAPLEVVVADDGSTDGSAEVLRELCKNHEAIRGVFLAARRGKGAAVRAALAEARGAITVIHDADLEYDAEDLPRVLKPILEGRADAVYGSRFAHGENRRVLYYRHAIGNRVITALSNLLTDLNLTDVETGCKAFRTALIRDLPIRCRTFTFEIEVTSKLAALGARIYEVPISYHGRSYLEGKKISWVDGLWALAAIVRFAFFKDLGPARPATRARIVSVRLKRLHAWLGRIVSKHTGDRIAQLLPDTGALTHHLVQNERVLCVEPDAAAAELLCWRFGHRPNVSVIAGEPSDKDVLKKLKKESVDTVLCVNALATVENDRKLVKQAADILPQNGQFIAIEPNLPGLFSPIDRAMGRKRRYSRKDLRALFEDAGLTLTEAKSVNRAGTLGWYVWGKILRRKSVEGPTGGLADRCTFLWRMLDYLVPLPGLSTFMVARKD